MKKHKLNIFPEAKPEDYGRLLDDIRNSGYDKKFPITIYEGDILDGWNRYRACSELGIKPTIVQFVGSPSEAIDFVMRTNKRRNFNSGQWATIAAEAEDLLDAIHKATAKEADAKRKENASNQFKKPVDKKLSEPNSEHDSKTAHKAASLFNTNRTYVNNAVKMRKAAPEVFEKVKAGTMTMQDGMKAVRAIPTSPWLDDEKSRKLEVENGHSVVANAERDKNLIKWAENNGLVIRIDRSSEFGNPFILGQDGDRDVVCNAYRDHYLPNKPSILSKRKFFKGKVLVCHCYPDRCHGESLVKITKK